jgi:hypothetical protein
MMALLRLRCYTYYKQLRKLFCKSREKWQRSKVLQEQSRNIGNIEHVISERFIWKLSFLAAVKFFIQYI